ncbi:uncharacterized protein LOC133295548 [Gastrolobium bilobum]|uniref:uncharacterized protein LOC133295548 n=1 Tax=Gastrolobium bilobum TaxID=150636 RepID=UPI002AAF4EBD|nr:uncharacterized protein LOC133295548 [Gastrolobium bilobum]
MDLQRNNSSSPSSSSNSINNSNPNKTTPSRDDPMQSWWESVSKARSRIHALAAILPSSSSDSLSTLADSDRPALSLLSSPAAYSAISASLSGSESDPLCHWLYDTFLSSDPHLRLVVLSFVPLLSGLYLSRIHSEHSPSLAGFEAILLAIYAYETKIRAGKPLLVTIPDLSHPSIYHSPLRKPPPSAATTPPSVGIISPPLEPQSAVKSTKRGCIVGVALHCYYSQISHMPSWSKLEFCRFSAGWAGQDCPCRTEFDPVGNDVNGEIEIEELEIEMGNLQILEAEAKKGDRIPLPWEILQPALRILGHCLLGPLNSQDVKDAASYAVRCLYARASHELVPQAILATRSLIQLDNRARDAAKAAAATATSNASTPTKLKKPEILLVSK